MQQTLCALPHSPPKPFNQHRPAVSSPPAREAAGRCGRHVETEPAHLKSSLVSTKRRFVKILVGVIQHPFAPRTCSREFKQNLWSDASDNGNGRVDTKACYTATKHCKALTSATRVSWIEHGQNFIGRLRRLCIARARRGAPVSVWTCESTQRLCCG